MHPSSGYVEECGKYFLKKAGVYPQNYIQSLQHDLILSQMNLIFFILYVNM
jgi:hypothetical protein